MDEHLIHSQLFFQDLSPEDVSWLLSMAEPLELKKGEQLIEEGAQGDSMYIILEGEFEVTKRAGDRQVVLSTREPGDYLGEMALVEGGPRTASVHAATDGRVYRISKATFDELITTHPAAMHSVLRTVMSRLRNTEAMLQQSQKLASLGTLAAGLAHELNNPAAAASRSSLQLIETLRDWPGMTLRLGGLGLDEKQAAFIEQMREEMSRRAASPPQLDPLGRSDQESALQDWLEARQIEPAWEIAPVLVSLGLEVKEVAQFSQSFNPEQFAAAIHWLCTGSTIYTLLDEVNKSAGRISEIVKAVKSYTFLDQAPVQEIDIHEGIENTLVILRSKLRAGITIRRDYAPGLPRIEAYGSELNQVWTNIIDNAADAMQGKGEIKIKTSRQDDQVVVEISDSGPGIPQKVQARIFDPFFTTKAPGSGTGLGLNITYNIIRHHHGHIEVASQPGETTFRISLPLHL